jgi:hypothetical protein
MAVLLCHLLHTHFNDDVPFVFEVIQLLKLTGVFKYTKGKQYIYIPSKHSKKENHVLSSMGPTAEGQRTRLVQVRC